MGVKNSYVKEGTFKQPPQKPLATTLSLVPSSVIAEAPESASPVIGCKVGSMHTSWHTSDKSFAVRSLTSLCHTMGNLPIGQDRACSTEKLVPQAHVEGGKCWLPAISESNSVSEGTFVEGETKFLQRQNSEPT